MASLILSKSSSGLAGTICGETIEVSEISWSPAKCSRLSKSTWNLRKGKTESKTCQIPTDTTYVWGCISQQCSTWRDKSKNDEAKIDRHFLGWSVPTFFLFSWRSLLPEFIKLGMSGGVIISKSLSRTHHDCPPSQSYLAVGKADLSTFEHECLLRIWLRVKLKTHHDSSDTQLI